MFSSKQGVIIVMLLTGDCDVSAVYGATWYFSYSAPSKIANINFALTLWEQSSLSKPFLHWRVQAVQPLDKFSQTPTQALWGRCAEFVGGLSGNKPLSQCSQVGPERCGPCAARRLCTGGWECSCRGAVCYCLHCVQIDTATPRGYHQGRLSW